MPVSSNNPCSDNSARADALFSAKRVLIIGAHPDDVEFYCGGLVYMLRTRGVGVTFAIATRGGKGKTGRAKARFEALRTQHQLDSARILGDVDVVFFDYPDKSLANHIGQLADDIRSLIEKLGPDAILSWDPDFIYNPHRDHQAAAEASKFASSGYAVYHYGTFEPNLWIGLDEDAFRIKIKSLRAHRTETPWYYYMLIKRRMIEKLAGEGRKVGCSYAEVLRRREDV